MNFNKYNQFFFLLTLMLFSLPSSIFAQCENDTTDPTPVCINGLTFTAIEGIGVDLWGLDINAASSDNCTTAGNLDFRIELSGGDLITPPETSFINIPAEVGTVNINLWVGDEAGNWGICITSIIIEVAEALCPGDTEAPQAICSNTETALSPPPGATAFVSANFLALASTDNCSEILFFSANLESQSTGSPQGGTILNFTQVGVYQVEVWARDEQGNTSSCISEVRITPPTGFDCENDTTAPTAACEAQMQISAHPVDGVTIWPQDINAGSSDFCTDVELSLEFSVEVGGPDIIVNDISVTLPPIVANYFAILHVTDENGNESSCITQLSVVGVATAITGHIYLDDNDNCELDEAEEGSGYEGWKIRATDLDNGTILEVFTNIDGQYDMNFISGSADNIQVEVVLPNGLSTNCSSSTTINGASSQLIIENFAIQSIEDCTYLSIDVSTPFLRRCFNNTYSINYSNYSGFDAEDANITVVLDPAMDIISADFSYSDLGNGQYLFDLGTIPANTAGSLSIVIYLSCEAELGQTHCMEARIVPFTCGDTQSFAELKVEGECDEALNEVRFKVTNIGDIATSSARSYIIVEDVVMYMQENDIDLGAGESMDFVYPANGATWRWEVEQDPSFPFGGIAASFIEGCGGFTANMATQFLLNNPKPNVAIDCQENIGSWDPNDKQAFPRGYGEEHFIKANTPIEYLIRFQNTGSDTAFNIVVKDQLSDWLDASTIRPGASSHPYRLEQQESGNLIFHFDNIMLPDSNVNLVGSNGFVKFYIEQIADAPLGTVIENTANIYFDFNEAVITNTVSHTIGEQFVIVDTQDVFLEGLSISIRPNPLQTEGQLVINNYDCKQGQMQLFDMTGRLLLNHKFEGHEIDMKRSQFPAAGIYFYNILEKGAVIAQGKLIVQ